MKFGPYKSGPFALIEQSNPRPSLLEHQAIPNCKGLRRKYFPSPTLHPPTHPLTSQTKLQNCARSSLSVKTHVRIIFFHFPLRPILTRSSRTPPPPPPPSSSCPRLSGPPRPRRRRRRRRPPRARRRPRTSSGGTIAYTRAGSRNWPEKMEETIS